MPKNRRNPQKNAPNPERVIVEGWCGGNPMFTLRSPLQLPNLVGPQTNHKPADCGTVKFICKNTSHLIRGQSKEKTSCYFFIALMLIVRTLLKGFSRYRLPPLFEEPSHHNGSHCKLLRGGGIDSLEPDLLVGITRLSSRSKSDANPVAA